MLKCLKFVIRAECGSRKPNLHMTLARMSFVNHLSCTCLCCRDKSQIIRPAQDLVPLVDSKFGAGSAFVAFISSIRATFKVSAVCYLEVYVLSGSISLSDSLW